MKPSLTWTFAVALYSAGCAALPPAEQTSDLSPALACSENDPRDSAVTVAALPDEGEAPYVDLLRTATTSIRVFGYQMGFGGILDTLQERARAGLDVRVILDGNTQHGLNDRYRVLLEAAGAKFEWSDPAFAYMHAKVLIVDDREAIVSTGNYSLSFIRRERNYVARIADRQDVADLARLFDADWTRTAPDLSCTRLVVAPVNARDRILALVASATRTLLVESMQLSDHAVKDAVFARKAAGVDVRVLLAAPSWIDENGRVGPALAAAGVPARWMATPGVHVKAIVADGARAYLGSENFSYTSLSKNREIGLILSDAPALATMSATFEKDWATATAF